MAPRLWLPIVITATLIGASSLGGAQTPRVTRAIDGAHRGYFAMRLLDDGQHQVIDELNADGFFVPASVLKVITVAAALEHLGAEYQWRTRLTSRGAIDGATLNGDLVIEPGADPTWGENRADGKATDPLDALAQQVRARGISRINGDVVVDASRFPGRPHPPDRSFNDLPYRHGTPPAALAVDEATIAVRVAPGRTVGEAARVAAPEGISVINHTTTVGRDRHGKGTLDFLPVWGTNTLLLRGEYPISEAPFAVSASDPSPVLRVAHRLRKALGEAGVTVEGGVLVRSQNGSTSDGTVVLAELRSRPLADLLERILTESHNWYADMLTLTLALEVAGSGRFEDGVEVISDFASNLDGKGSSGLGGDDTRAGLWIRDGSGLSATNLVTPTTVVRVIAYAVRQPWGRTVVNALAEPGAGTLAAWPHLPPVAAKTGTLRHTVGLAGILEAKSKRPVIFCYFVNHHPDRPWSARAEIAEALGKWRAFAPSASSIRTQAPTQPSQPSVGLVDY